MYTMLLCVYSDLTINIQLQDILFQTSLAAETESVMAVAPWRILLAEDHEVVRRGICQILAGAIFPVNISEAASGQLAVELVRQNHFDLLILDINLPDGNGTDILPSLKQADPRLRILVLTMHAEEQFALRLLKSGVAGYLTKDRAPEEIVRAVKKVLSGGKYVSSEMAEQIALSMDLTTGRALHESLSDREFQVLCMIGRGMSVSAIAQKLFLHARTVGTFRRHILTKLHLKNTMAIADYAIREGLVDWSRNDQPPSN